jgi:hypothetical protein
MDQDVLVDHQAGLDRIAQAGSQPMAGASTGAAGNGVRSGG